MAKKKDGFDGDSGLEGLATRGLLARRTDPDPEDDAPSLKDLKGSRSSRGYPKWEPKDGGGPAGGGTPRPRRTGAGPT